MDVLLSSLEGVRLQSDVGKCYFLNMLSLLSHLVFLDHVHLDGSPRGSLGAEEFCSEALRVTRVALSHEQLSTTRGPTGAHSLTDWISAGHGFLLPGGLGRPTGTSIFGRLDGGELNVVFAC